MIRMTSAKTVRVGNVEFANDKPLSIIAGPCVMENRDHAMMMAESLTTMCQDLGIGLVYKSSFDKANRSSASSERGLGFETALPIFEEIKKTFGCPVVTDVHEPDQCAPVAEVVDLLQIPAYLCRQTSLLVAAAKTGRAINVKKGQFLAPWDMDNVAAKITSAGNDELMLCERGTSFGYNTLVTDFRGLPRMAQTGHPVIFDATHSVQQPGGQGATTGGQREYVPVLARAAVSLGVAGVFLETHNDPEIAPCDGPNMIALGNLRDLLVTLQKFDQLAKNNPISID
jgi:2-dehydro-3-deoxyphosphooctonate aldolase (KDO 8-P synthase)